MRLKLSRRLYPSQALQAGLLGLAWPLGFAPFSWFWLPPLLLAGLLALTETATPRQAFKRGYFFGLGAFGLGISWIHISLADFGGMNLGLAVIATALFVAYLALYPALAVSVQLSALSPIVRRLFLFPMTWVLFAEVARSWFFTGFPWLLVGQSQVTAPLGGLVPLIGGVGVSAVVALSAGLLWHSLATRQWWPGLALLVFWLGAASLGQVAWTQASGPPLTVALVQGNIPQPLKWLPELRQATLQKYVQLTRQHWDAQLVVWPETAVPDFLHRVWAEHIAPIEAEAIQQHSTLLVGAPVLHLGTNHYFNGLISLGAQRGAYYKRHLVPLGEYLPLQPLVQPILGFLQVPMSDFTPGPVYQPPLPVPDAPLGAFICYETAYPAQALATLPQAQLLVTVSNDAWFGDSLAPHQHLQIAQLRAREAGRWLLRATNTGISALIRPDGQIQTQTPQFVTTVLRGIVTPYQGQTPYLRWGDTGVVLLLLALFGSLFLWDRFRMVASRL